MHRRESLKKLTNFSRLLLSKQDAREEGFASVRRPPSSRIDGLSFVSFATEAEISWIRNETIAGDRGSLCVGRRAFRWRKKWKFFLPRSLPSVVPLIAIIADYFRALTLIITRISRFSFNARARDRASTKLIAASVRALSHRD